MFLLLQKLNINLVCPNVLTTLLLLLPLSVFGIRNATLLEPLNLYEAQLRESSQSNPAQAIEIAETAINFIQEKKLSIKSGLPFFQFTLDYLAEKGKEEEGLLLLNTLKSAIPASNDQNVQITYNFLVGYYFQTIQKPDSAQYYFENVLSEYPEDAIDEIKGLTHKILGAIQAQAGHHDEAIENLLLALHIYNNLNNAVEKLKTQSLLALEYRAIENHTSFEELANQADRIFNASRQFITDPEVFLYLGKLKLTSNPDSAQWFFDQGMKLSNNRPTASTTIKLQYQSAKRLYDQGQYTEAGMLLENINSRLVNKHDPFSRVLTFNLLSAIALSQNKTSLAEKLVDSSLHYLTLLPYSDLTLATMQMKREVAWQNGSSSAILTTLNNKIDSLQTEKKKRQLAGTIKIVNKAREKASLSFQNDLLKLEIDAQKKQITLRFLWIAITIAGAISLYLIFQKIKKTTLAKEYTVRALLKRYEMEILDQVALEKGKNNQQLPDEFEQKLKDLFEEQKIYLDPDLKVEQVASELNLSYKQFKEFLARKYQVSFKQYVNQYRIDHAKKIMLAPSYNHLSIEGIAMESGFGTKQSFYRAFQQFVGLKPGEFKEMSIDS